MSVRRNSDDPHRLHVTITFVSQDQKTLVTLCSLFATAKHCQGAKRVGAVKGGKQTLARLDEYRSIIQ